MVAPAISVQGLSKRYVLGAMAGHDTLRDQLAHGAKALWRTVRMGSKPETERAADADTFWALKDLSFELGEGEVLGVIGRNGAGKSTLLKLLSQITEPTEGEVRIRGRVASLLEVGTGFHPELTGRENIYLNGAVLGMSRSETRKKFDEIVAFSEVEKFLDTPVKRYSSGMFVRLAFAVAAHLEPDIMIVDEVLAVGDSAFQNKCLGKMQNIAKAGRTVMFVSHNIGMISNLCTRGLVLQKGRLVYYGETAEAVRQYNHLVARGSSDHETAGVLHEIPPPVDGSFAITKVEMLEADGSAKEVVGTWDDLTFRIQYHCPRPVPRGSVAIQFTSFDGTRVAVLSTEPDSTLPIEMRTGINTVELNIPRLPFAAGEYLLSFGIAMPHVEYLSWQQDICTLSVIPRDVYKSGLAPALPRSLMALDHRWKKID
jgi:lipopolysaccharide transport system ATP-binding protein